MENRPIKVSKIILEFERENSDPKTIAQKLGFANHRDMAIYMKKQGYEWKVEKNNYMKSSNIPTKEDDSNTIELESFQDYLPFISTLYKNRDKLDQLLSRPINKGQIPRYALPGITRTKAIYMNDTVGKLIVEFSKEKNVTQREIVEAALVEYLQNYGYAKEVEGILGIR